MIQVRLWAAVVVTGLFTACGYAQMNVDELFVGSNNLGQSADSFLAAEACDVTIPIPTGTVEPNMHLILIANGTDSSGSVRLSQNSNEVTVLAPNSISCNANGIHAGTSYYREFSLAGVSGDLELSSIELGIELCNENVDGSGPDMNGFVPIQICLYYDTPVGSITHSGVSGPSGFDETFCAEIAADGSADETVVTIPISATVASGTGTLVVEIFTPGSDTEPATDYCFNKNPGGCDFELGDVNNDGSVDLLDVDPFVSALTSGTYICEGDVNEDGALDLLDVQPFVDILTGG